MRQILRLNISAILPKGQRPGFAAKPIAPSSKPTKTMRLRSSGPTGTATLSTNVEKSVPRSTWRIFTGAVAWA